MFGAAENVIPGILMVYEDGRSATAGVVIDQAKITDLLPSWFPFECVPYQRLRQLGLCYSSLSLVAS